MDTDSSEPEEESSLRTIIQRRQRRKRDASQNPALLRLATDVAELHLARGVEAERRLSDPWAVWVRLVPCSGWCDGFFFFFFRFFSDLFSGILVPLAATSHSVTCFVL